MTRSGRRPRAVEAVLVGVLLGLALLVWGGYVRGWAWTGLSSDVRLWDWWEALLLPVTVGLVPVLLTQRRRWRRRHLRVAGAVLVVFVLLVLAGYLVPMRWTGFTGNTLWDWLSLALLPLVIATATLWRWPRRWTTRHVSLLGAAVVIAGIVVAAGYLVPWAWTGFRGNTAWDWLKLLLLPLLVPTVVLPRALEAAEGWSARRQGPAPSARHVSGEEQVP